jgi:oligopeptide transport system permease protein
MMVEKKNSIPDLNTQNKPQRDLLEDAFIRLTRNKAAMTGAIIIALFILMAIFAKQLAPYNPIEIHSGKGFLPPVWLKEGPNGALPDPAYIMGTDTLGRDILSRTIYGTRVSIVVGFLPTLIILLIGVSMGLISGYVGGKVDNFLMRLTDVVYAFPDLLFFIIAMITLRETWFGKLFNGLALLFCALAIVNWVGVARVVRGQVLSIKEKEFIEAARCVGARDLHIMFKHILPNSLGPVIILTAFSIPMMIITEAILGYLGLGMRPSTNPNDIFLTSWGSMLLEGQSALNAQPWVLLIPAICVALLVLSFTFLGDGFRDALDPRLQGTE